MNDEPQLYRDYATLFSSLPCELMLSLRVKTRQDVFWSIWFETLLRGWLFISDVVVFWLWISLWVLCLLAFHRAVFLHPSSSQFSPPSSATTHQVQRCLLFARRPARLFICWLVTSSVLVFFFSLSLVCRPRKKIRANQIVASVSANHTCLVLCPPTMDDKSQETRVVINKALVRVSVLLPRESNRLAIGSIFFIWAQGASVCEIQCGWGYLVACGSRMQERTRERQECISPFISDTSFFSNNTSSPFYSHQASMSTFIILNTCREWVSLHILSSLDYPSSFHPCFSSCCPCFKPAGWISSQEQVVLCEQKKRLTNRQPKLRSRERSN